MKVLDWTDEEPLIGYLLLSFLESVCEIKDLDQERLSRILFELYKRVLSLHQTPSTCNLSQLLPLSKSLLLLKSRLDDPTLRSTVPTLAFDRLKPLLCDSKEFLAKPLETANFIRCLLFD